ncbi:MAG: acetolactate synthase large subunit [Candidatus Brocadiaceae bacterium]|nr:acetolactate synthase large subunit [Candidatus Brocadiaceae bacterium]
MKASDLFIKQLLEEGVEYIFGLPGEENLDLLDSIRKAKIKLFITRHEQAAAFMAATYGRLTGKAGVCFSTLGPGVTNLVTGIAHAQFIGAPLVAITGQKALLDNWQAKFQSLDAVSLMRPITKNSVTIVDPNNIPTIVRNAFKLAEDERPGAAHIELPEDVASAKTKANVQKRGSARRPSPDHRAIDEASELINRAKFPLIILSSGANRKKITKHLLDFITKTNIHVVHTQMGKGVIGDDCQYSLFATGIHTRDYVNCGIDLADLIITIGYNTIEYPPFVWNKDLDKKIINIDFVASQTDKYFNPDVEIIGDITHSLRELSTKVEMKSIPQLKKLRSFLEKKLHVKKEGTYPLNPKEVVFHVRNTLDKNDIVTLDNGIYKLWFSRLYRTYTPNTLLLDNALATMGAGLPSALTAKILNPEKKVLAVVGDGGFMMNSQEMETAVRYKIPVVVLILNDNAFGFIKWKQKNMKFKSFALDYGNPDFVKYGESYGAKSFRVNKGDNLSELLDKAFSLRDVALIECPVDYSLNYDVFSEELKNYVCDIS